MRIGERMKFHPLLTQRVIYIYIYIYIQREKDSERVVLDYGAMYSTDRFVL
jgi:hypothetical protein